MSYIFVIIYLENLFLKGIIKRYIEKEILGWLVYYLVFKKFKYEEN